jgi:hypothetical protein
MLQFAMTIIFNKKLTLTSDVHVAGIVLYESKFNYINVEQKLSLKSAYSAIGFELSYYKCNICVDSFKFHPA